MDLSAPILAAFNASKEWQETALKAYPVAPVQEKKKKEKKPKDKGSGYPGAKKDVAATGPFTIRSERPKTEEKPETTAEKTEATS